jgi:hypothetical protein
VYSLKLSWTHYFLALIIKPKKLVSGWVERWVLEDIYHGIGWVNIQRWSWRGVWEKWGGASLRGDFPLCPCSRYHLSFCINMYWNSKFCRHKRHKNNFGGKQKMLGLSIDSHNWIQPLCWQVPNIPGKGLCTCKAGMILTAQQWCWDLPQLRLHSYS